MNSKKNPYNLDRLYPKLTYYYFQRIIQDLINDEFLLYETTNTRRRFIVNEMKGDKDIGYISWE